MKVDLINFDREHKFFKDTIFPSVNKVIASGRYLMGPNLLAFEKKLAKYVGVKYAVGVHSGTDSLLISILSLGLTHDDEVVVPANVYPTSFGVALSRVRMVLADVDPNSLNVSLDNISKVVTKKTKAIVVVHLYGNPVDILPIREFARKRSIALIEDCAQAIGASIGDKKVGSFGEISCFSFYPTKNLGAYGDAGAMLTNSRKIADIARSTRMYGEKMRYDSRFVGMNSRLDELQSAILLEKFKKLNYLNLQRSKIAKRYIHEFKDLQLELLTQTNQSKSSNHLFVIKVKSRNKFIEYLSKNGISSGIHYPTPIHLVSAYSNLGYKIGDFPVSERASREVLSLPINPFMTDDEVDYVIQKVKLYFSKHV